MNNFKNFNKFFTDYLKQLTAISVQTISFGHIPNHQSSNNDTYYFPLVFLTSTSAFSRKAEILHSYKLLSRECLFSLLTLNFVVTNPDTDADADDDADTLQADTSKHIF